jgi:predicted dehydrogenase
MRKSRFFQKDAYISVDFLEKKVEVVKMKDAPENPGDFDMVLQNAEGIKKQIYFENPTIASNNAILDELQAFADAINNDTTPIVSLKQGTEALKVALQIIASFEDSKVQL